MARQSMALQAGYHPKHLSESSPSRAEAANQIFEVEVSSELFDEKA